MTHLVRKRMSQDWRDIDSFPPREIDNSVVEHECAPVAVVDQALGDAEQSSTSLFHGRIGNDVDFELLRGLAIGLDRIWSGVGPFESYPSGQTDARGVMPATRAETRN